jgi:hypothetical protein
MAESVMEKVPFWPDREIEELAEKIMLHAETGSWQPVRHFAESLVERHRAPRREVDHNLNVMNRLAGMLLRRVPERARLRNLLAGYERNVQPFLAEGGN